jgi:hypothetical protein
VTYLPDMPPRIAAWRSSLGCAQLPIGATMEMVKSLPRLPASLNHPNFDDRAWPMGDQQATAELPVTRKADLDGVVAKAFDGQTYRGSTWGVVVIKDGKIVAERRRVNAHARADQLDVQEPRSDGCRRRREEGPRGHSQESAPRRMAAAR